MATIEHYMTTLEKAALNAVSEEEKLAKRLSFDGKTGLEGPQRSAVFRDYMNKLMARYPYDKDNKDLDKTLNQIEVYPADDMHAFLQQFNTPNRQVLAPDEYYKVQEAAKILPLLQGVAKEGDDWYSKSTRDLKEAGLRAGFPVEYQSGYADFLNQIADMQTTYDRAKLLKDAQDSTTAYGLKRLVAPTAWKEFENALATGGDYDKGDAVRSGAIDALANSIILSGPTVVSKAMPTSKVLSQWVSPLVQASGEFDRQVLADALSKNGVEFEAAPIVTTGAAGATIPSIIGVAQRLASKIPGKKAQEFARGIAKANKLGDPVENEADELLDAVTAYGKAAKTNNAIKQTNEVLQKIKQGMIELDATTPGATSAVNVGGVMKPISEMNTVASYPMELSEAMRLINTNRVPKYAELFGIKPTNGAYKADDILNAYRKKINANLGVNDKGEFVLVNSNPLLTPAEAAGMSPAQLNTYQSLFPARYADAVASSPSLRAGYAVGSKLGEYGGAAEATLKPVQVNDLFNLVTGDGLKKPTYQSTKTYQDNAKKANKYKADTRTPTNSMDTYLKSKNVKDLFDLVFKKKEEDEEE